MHILDTIRTDSRNTHI